MPVDCCWKNSINMLLPTGWFRRSPAVKQQILSTKPGYCTSLAQSNITKINVTNKKNEWTNSKWTRSDTSLRWGLWEQSHDSATRLPSQINIHHWGGKVHYWVLDMLVFRKNINVPSESRPELSHNFLCYDDKIDGFLWQAGKKCNPYLYITHPCIDLTKRKYKKHILTKISL